MGPSPGSLVPGDTISIPGVAAVDGWAISMLPGMRQAGLGKVDNLLECQDRESLGSSYDYMLASARLQCDRPTSVVSLSTCIALSSLPFRCLMGRHTSGDTPASIHL